MTGNRKSRAHGARAALTRREGGSEGGRCGDTAGIPGSCVGATASSCQAGPAGRHGKQRSENGPPWHLLAGKWQELGQEGAGTSRLQRVWLDRGCSAATHFGGESQLLGCGWQATAQQLQIPPASKLLPPPPRATPPPPCGSATDLPAPVLMARKAWEDTAQQERWPQSHQNLHPHLPRVDLYYIPSPLCGSGSH